MPEEIDFFVITTLIGGTVGGYITFAGAHRLIDSGLSGPEHVKDITTTSVMGIIITGIMRVLLFLAVLGVVSTGVALSEDNTAADAFFHAAGEFGLRAFGVVLFAAGLSSGHRCFLHLHHLCDHAEGCPAYPQLPHRRLRHWLYYLVLHLELRATEAAHLRRCIQRHHLANRIRHGYVGGLPSP